MKKITTILLVLFSLSATAQGVDSTRITGVYDLEQKFVLHFLAGADQNDPDVWNMTKVFKPQMDTVGKEFSGKIIHFPALPAGLLAGGMRRLAGLPEGVATSYNNDMLDRILPKITNPWLFSQMVQIRDANWKIRDQRTRAEYDKMLKRD